eukprot:217962_1
MSKEALVIVLDIGSTMGNLRENSGMTGLDQAKTAFRLMVQQKLLFGYKQDVCSLVLFNSRNTDNPSHEKYGGYESVEEYFKLNTPNLDLLECIDNVQCNPEGKNGDAMDAVLAASEIIVNYCAKKKYTKRIFLITDANTPINGDNEMLTKICNSFVGENIKFYCIGIGFGEEEEPDSDNDDDQEDDEGTPSFEDWCKTIKLVQNNPLIERNELILRYLSHCVGGTVFCPSSAIELLSQLRSKSILTRPQYSGALEITSKLKINVKLYCRCRKQTLPSLKKESAVGNETGKVCMDRVYRNKFRAAADDEEVEEDERVKSYLYGKERIPFAENDEMRLNYKAGDRHFKCLGFIDACKVSRHEFMGTTSIVVPDVNSTRSQYLLSAFIHSCHEKKMNILCRLVARKNASPKFVVLQPRIKTDKECLICNELPFFEDLRKFPFASFNIKPSYTANKRQIGVCKDLVKSLNLMCAAIDDDGERTEALKPQHCFNPILQRYYQNLQNRALDPMAGLQALDPVILKSLEPDPILFDNANTKHCIQQFEKSFPTKLVPKKEVKKERKHWNDMSNELDHLFGDLAVDNGDNKANNMKDEASDDDDDAMDLMNIDVNKITQIGTTSPTSDFDYLLSKQTCADLFERLSSEFWKVIYQLIDVSFGDTQYGKALTCIAHLKESAIKEEEPVLFNTELRKFKLKYKERNKKLWSMGVIKGITLICDADFDDGDVPQGLTVTNKECMEFVTEQEEKVEAVKDEMDQDDDE